MVRNIEIWGEFVDVNETGGCERKAAHGENGRDPDTEERYGERTLVR